MIKPGRAAMHLSSFPSALACFLICVSFAGCDDAADAEPAAGKNGANLANANAGGADLSLTGDSPTVNKDGTDAADNSGSSDAVGNAETADATGDASSSDGGSRDTGSSAGDSNAGVSSGDADTSTDNVGTVNAGTDGTATGAETTDGGIANGETASDGGDNNANMPPTANSTNAAAEDQRDFESKRGADGVYDLTFDDIKFEMETGGEFKREMIGNAIESLAGKPIRIRGFIFPTTMQRPKSFILVRDNLECCFGPGAALYDCVRVEMKPGKDTEYTTRPIAVEGTFSVEVIDFDGMVMSIYRLDADWAK